MCLSCSSNSSGNSRSASGGNSNSGNQKPNSNPSGSNSNGSSSSSNGSGSTDSGNGNNSSNGNGNSSSSNNSNSSNNSQSSCSHNWVQFFIHHDQVKHTEYYTTTEIEIWCAFCNGYGLNLTDTYGTPECAEATKHIIGCNASYSGKPIYKEEQDQPLLKLFHN